MVMHAYNPSTPEAEAGGSRLGGHHGIYIARTCLKNKSLEGTDGDACNPTYLGG
jgi:hypothetical protein